MRVEFGIGGFRVLLIRQLLHVIDDMRGDDQRSAITQQPVILRGCRIVAAFAVIAIRIIGIERLECVDDMKIVVGRLRSAEHTSELQSLMRNSYAVFCLKQKNTTYIKQSVV